MALGGSLVQRAAARLAGGPAHTLELAREVLGLSGNAGAASRAIFTLLGCDRRFQVDADGMWRIGDPARAPGPPLTDVGFAVVDVETTGSLGADRIMDIAIVEVRGGAVVDGKPSPWIVVQDKAVRAMVALSMRLRLSPQSRTDPKTLARQPQYSRPRPWEANE